MNASKEEAKKMVLECDNIAVELDELNNDVGVTDRLKRRLIRLQNFVEACVPRLPSEAAIQRNKERSRRKA